MYSYQQYTMYHTLFQALGEGEKTISRRAELATSPYDTIGTIFIYSYYEQCRR